MNDELRTRLRAVVHAAWSNALHNDEEFLRVFGSTTIATDIMDNDADVQAMVEAGEVKLVDVVELVDEIKSGLAPVPSSNDVLDRLRAAEKLLPGHSSEYSHAPVLIRREGDLVPKLHRLIGDDQLPSDENGKYIIPPATSSVLITFFGPICKCCGGSRGIVNFLNEVDEPISSHLVDMT